MICALTMGRPGGMNSLSHEEERSQYNNNNQEVPIRVWDYDLDLQGDQDYHSLYLQQHGLEFMMPILFEDGMDFVECELYYASINAQLSGGAPRRSQFRSQRRAGLQDLRTDANGAPLSCIRESNRAKKSERRVDPPVVRRCSFSGLPGLADSDMGLPRSKSQRALRDLESRVSFEEYVQVVTIHRVEDYPLDVRSQMWMSRQEMVQCVRRAMNKEAREQLSLERKGMSETLKVLVDDDIATTDRVPSVDSVVEVCMQSHFSELGAQ
jgi:hypothetical protein